MGRNSLHDSNGGPSPVRSIPIVHGTALGWIVISLLLATVQAGGVLAVTDWTCATDDWTTTACWSRLEVGDNHPQDDVDASYAVTIPDGPYTVHVDTVVTISDLIVSGRPTLEVDAGQSLLVLSNLTADATLRSLGSLTADPGAVVDIDEANLMASTGGLLNLTATSYTASPGCASESLRAAGIGSALTLGSLTSIDGTGCGAVTVQADDEGTVDLSALTTSTGNVVYQALGSASEIRLTQLSVLSDGSVTVRDGGTIVAAPFSTLEGVKLTIDGATSTIDLSRVTSIDTSTVTAVGTASVGFPLISSYTGSSGCGSESLQALGAGSVLDLSTVFTLDAFTCGSVTSLASHGGLIDLSQLTELSGNLVLRSEGAGSEIRLHLVSAMADGSVTVRDGGTILAAPFTSLEGITLTIDGPTSVLDVSQITSLDESNVTIDGAADISFPLMSIYSGSSDCGSETLKASGAGSILNLSTVTTLEAFTCGNVFVFARQGGMVDLSQLSVFSGNLSPRSEGVGSEIRLNQISVMTDGTVTVRDGGSIVAAPFTTLDGITLTVDGPGNKIDLSHVASLALSNVTIDGGAHVFFPQLTAYVGSVGCASETLKAVGAGSVLDLSRVTDLTSGDCGILRVSAISGGVVDLTSLDVVTSPHLLADEVDSVLSVKGIHFGTGGRIVATDGGTIVVNESVAFEFTSAANFAWSGGSTLSMPAAGGAVCPSLEIAGADFGDDPTGHVDNFNLDRFSIGPGARIRLVDAFDNGNRGAGGKSEVLYVDTLTFEDPTGRLFLGLHRLYFNTLIGDATQVVAFDDYAAFAEEFAGPAVLVDCPFFDADGDEDVDLDDFADFQNMYAAA